MLDIPEEVHVRTTMGLLRSVTKKVSGNTDPTIWALDYEADRLPPGKGSILLFVDDRLDEPKLLANDYIAEVSPGTLLEPMGTKAYIKLGPQRVPIEQFKMIPPNQEPSLDIEECEGVPDHLVGTLPLVEIDEDEWDQFFNQVL